MPASHAIGDAPAAAVHEPTPTERFTRTLVGLTRAFWNPGCTFQTAIGEICVAAARALQIERVSVWRYDASEMQLQCLHTYRADTDEHQPPELLETLSVDGDDYIEALKTARTFNVADVGLDPAAEDAHQVLHGYLQRHGIRAVLDAPAFVGGELEGVICHGSTNSARIWSREEITFAASMGDYVAIAFEIARRRRAEAEIEHLRLHDGPTGLPNRDYMIELIRQRLAMRDHGEQVPTVVTVKVNAAGGGAWSSGALGEDAVMARIAQRLRSFTGYGVELARTRSNSLSFLITASPAKRTVIRLAEGVLSALKGMEWEAGESTPSACVGITVAARDGIHDARVLLRQGEEAADHAAEGERFGFAVYDHEHHLSLVEDMRQERALRDAFANGHLELHYQPEYCAASGEWVAAESLLRWRDGDRLRVAGEFIGVLELSDLMLSVGRWVLQQACMDAVQWPPGTDGRPIGVRVNVSVRQFDAPGLVEDVTAALQASGLDPGRLCLELTETTLMRDIDHALEILRHFSELGVEVAIDDFGTGYASLVYLKRLPIDVLKIDRSFVQGMPDDAADMAIVQAIVALADAFDIDVVAEGVELLAQQEALMAMGVYRMQGWRYGKAMPSADLRRLLAAPAEIRPGD